MKKNLTLLLLCCAYVLSAQTFVPTTTIMPWGATWKWKNNSTDLGTAWYASGYNDAAFSSGAAPLGYGSVDAGYFGLVIPAQSVSTSIGSSGAAGGTNTATFYFRSTFTISTSSYSVVQFKLRVDDGCAIYLNGQMVSTAMTKYATASTTNSTVSTSTVALPFQLAATWTYTSMTNAQTTDGQDMFTFTLSATNTLLVNGTNTIAVEAHNRSNDSSDMLWAMQVEGGTISSAPPAAPSIVKGPYLQVGTQNSMVIRWETNIATDSKVMYGSAPATLASAVSNTDQVTSHEIQITGLTAYTKYYYNIGTTTSTIQGDADNYFLTSPTPGTEGKYRFWVIGDCGNASTNQVNVKDQYKNFNGSRITNGWLTLGDNAYSNGSDPQFNAEFFSIYQNDVMKNKVLWPVPGNHDYNNGAVTSSTTPYFSIFNVPTAGEAGGVASGTKAYYSYDYGNIHFIALDSYGTVSGNKMYDTLGAQAVWLKQDLAANTKKWVIAYWHHPPYTMGSHNSDTEGDLVAIRQKFIRILERYKVDLILCGHSHDYERSKLMQGHYGDESTFNAATHNLSQSSGLYDGTSNSCPYTKDSVMNKSGTVYVLSGSAGQLGGQQTSFPHDAMYYSNASNGGSLILDIEGNRLDAQWLCADGVVRDKFTIYKDVNSVKTLTLLPTETKTLQASWPGNYTWKDGSTTQTISVSSATNTTVWVKDPNSCVADTFKLRILPAVDFTVSAPYCAATAIAFTDLSTNNTSAWSWSVSPFLGVTISSASAKNPDITFTNAGTYTVSLIADNAYGSGSIITKTITVTAKPLVLASLSSTAICVNQSATLTASGASSYSWSSGSTATLITIAPTANTVYTLTGTDALGCQSTSTKTLVVNSLPLVTANSNPTTAVICAGETLSLNGSGASTYSWTGGITNANSFTLSAGLTYTVTGTDANGCQNTATKSITVNALPVLSISSTPTSAAVCNGSSLALTASGANTYTWSGASNITNNTAFTPTSTSVYTVTATDNNGCANSMTQAVTVNSLPVILISGNAAVCKGSAVTLTASGATSYVWSSAGTSSLLTVTPSITSSYTVTGIDANSCQASQIKMITVNPLPTVTISGNMVLCAGETTTIQSSGASTYSWSNGTLSANLIIAPLTGYNYMVTGTDANGCKNTATTAFSINALPTLIASSTKSIICVGETSTLSVSGAATYLWNTSASSSNIVISPLFTTTYSVTGVNANNCSSSASIVQDVNECTGLNKLSLDKNVLVYPNPNKGAFNIELNTQGNFNADIFNTLGERVYSAKLQQGHNAIRLEEKKGIYFYVILDDTKVIETGKLIVE